MGMEEDFGKKQFMMFLFTKIGIFITLLAFFYTRDLLISSLIWLLYLGLFCFIWDKFFYDFKWEFHLLKDLIEYKVKLITAAITALVNAILVTGLLLAWHYYGVWVTPIYWLSAPKFEKDLFWVNYLYWGLVFVVVGVFLPLMEELFWRVFINA
jgi:hypothetical protein